MFFAVCSGEIEHYTRFEVWEALELTCEPEVDTFTRDTIYHVIESKRCPHTGSCFGKKCATVNVTRATACVGSCGGPGCDCFYWPGCLFYRVYVTPVSPQVYENFHCNRWREAAKIEWTYFDANLRKTRFYTAHMHPSVPVLWKSFSFTLSSITIPPTPVLHKPFISDENQTAIWNTQFTSPLQ
ncbi:unnamed protein product, partial [Strongylus vulgaris]